MTRAPSGTRTLAGLLAAAILHVVVATALGLSLPATGERGEHRVSAHLTVAPILLPPTADESRFPGAEPVRAVRSQRTAPASRLQAALAATAEHPDPQLSPMSRRQVLLPQRLCATGDDGPPTSTSSAG